MEAAAAACHCRTGTERDRIGTHGNDGDSHREARRRLPARVERMATAGVDKGELWAVLSASIRLPGG